MIAIGSDPPSGAVTVQTYLALDPSHPPVHCAWFADPPDGARPADRAWLVEERPRWDELDGPGITRFSFLRRTADIDHDEFARRWDRHVALARRHHPALRRYVQNIVVEPDCGVTGIDGIVELGFASVKDLEQRMYDSDEGRAVIGADVRTFIDVAAGTRVVTEDPR